MPRVKTMLGLALLVSLHFLHSDAFYVSHVFNFPGIPYSSGVHHIHSPDHFMESHGFTLPGFEILDTSEPKYMGNYVTVGFSYKTYFSRRMTARIFSSSLDTSHVLLMDPDGIPCMLGKLWIDKCSSNGHLVKAHAELLRPARIWERLFGGDRLVKQCDVERSIRVGYSNFKYDSNFKCYMAMVISYAKERESKE